jgi:integrase
MAHRQQGYIFRRTRRLPDGSTWTSPHYSIGYRVGRRLKVESIGPKKKDAARVLADRLATLHAGTYREIAPTTFGEWAAQWAKGLTGLKPSTASAYRSILRGHLIPAFGDRPLDTIGVADVNAYLADREGLTVKTRRNHLALLHKLLGDAVEGDRVAANRLAGSKALRRPKAIREADEAPEVDILSPEEVNRLLDALTTVAGGASYPLFLTAVCTGMRLGELLALQWQDIDGAGRQIHVRRSVYKGTFYVPKTKRGRRRIDVGAQLLGVLDGLRLARAADAPDALVFPNAQGGALDPDNLGKRVWERALALAGLRHVKIHSLRHTFASLLIAQGESVKYIQTQLGHASAMMTLNVYGHLFPSEKRTAAARLEESFLRSKLLADPAEPARTEADADGESVVGSARNAGRMPTEADGG